MAAIHRRSVVIVCRLAGSAGAGRGDPSIVVTTSRKEDATVHQSTLACTAGTVQTLPNANGVGPSSFGRISLSPRRLSWSWPWRPVIVVTTSRKKDATVPPIALPRTVGTMRTLRDAIGGGPSSFGCINGDASRLSWSWPWRPFDRGDQQHEG